MIIITTSTLFIYGENSINKGDLQTSLITIDEFEKVQTEDFYREQIKNYNDSIIILKKDAMIHFLSQKIKDDLGYPDEELLNKNLFKFIHPKDLPFFANVMIDIILEKKIQSSIGPFRIKNIEGQYNMYMADGYPVGSNEIEEVQGIVLVIKDISEPVGNK